MWGVFVFGGAFIAFGERNQKTVSAEAKGEVPLTLYVEPAGLSAWGES